VREASNCNIQSLSQRMNQLIEKPEKLEPSSPENQAIRFIAKGLTDHAFIPSDDGALEMRIVKLLRWNPSAELGWSFRELSLPLSRTMP